MWLVIHSKEFEDIFAVCEYRPDPESVSFCGELVEISGPELDGIEIVVLSQLKMEGETQWFNLEDSRHTITESEIKLTDDDYEERFFGKLRWWRVSSYLIVTR